MLCIKKESNEMIKIFFLMFVLFMVTKSHAVSSNHYYVKYFDEDNLKISKVVEERNFDICKKRKMEQEDYNIVNALLRNNVSFIDTGNRKYENCFRIGIEILNMFLENDEDKTAENLLKELVDYVKSRRHIRTRNCDIDDFVWKDDWLKKQKWIDQIDGDFRQELMERYPEVKDQIEKLIPDNRPLNIVLAEKVTNLWNNWFHNKPANAEKSPLLIKEE